MMIMQFTRCALLGMLAVSAAQAQQSPTQLGSSLGLFVYPASEQSAEQQSKDDYACFGWAKTQTGYDPLNPASPAAAASAGAQATPQADGTVARGALRGAARGAVIGEIADDDAGKGAGVGAAVGAFRGADRRRAQAAAQQQQAGTQAQTEQKEQVDGFKRAYGACMGSRSYTVN